MFCLEALGQRSAGSSAYYNLVARGDGPYRVGRAENCHIRLQHTDISRQHATLEVLTLAEYLRRTPIAHAVYNHFKTTNIEAMRRAAAEAEGYADADDIGALDDHGLLEAFADHEDAMMHSLVLCVQNYSKFGCSTREAPQQQHDDDEGAGHALLEPSMSNATAFTQGNQANMKRDASMMSMSSAASAAPVEATPISSVAYFPSVTDRAFILSFGARAHFKLTFRPVLVSISHLHYAPEHVRDMTTMMRQLGCSVLPEGEPVPVYETDGLHEYLILAFQHAASAGKLHPATAAKKDGSRSQGKFSVQLESILSPSKSGISMASGTSAAETDMGSLLLLQGSPMAAGDAMGATTAGMTGAGDSGPSSMPGSPTTQQARRSADDAFARQVHPNPLARLHICDEIDDSAAVLRALAIGYSVVLPVYIFELFSLLSANPARPLHTLPHPCKSIGGASAEPQRKRAVYGSAIYCHPEPESCPFSLYNIPQSSTKVRSRRGLFAQRLFYLPNPMVLRRNAAPLVMCGAKCPLADIGDTASMALFDPPTHDDGGLRQRGRSDSPASTNSSTLEGGRGGSVDISRSIAGIAKVDREQAPSATLTFGVAGRYVVVDAQLEGVVAELCQLATTHFAAYQRYPLAVIMAHSHILREVLPSAAVEEEVRAVLMAVHRGFMPIREAALHAALLTNTFSPSPIESLVMMAIEEQRHLGLHLQGFDESERVAEGAEEEQRRDRIHAIFGSMLAKDPESVSAILETHNDSLFQQLSADKAAKYAAAADSVFAAGPTNLGGGVLHHTDATNPVDKGYFSREQHILRRSLPLPHEQQKQHNNKGAAHKGGDMGLVDDRRLGGIGAGGGEAEGEDGERGAYDDYDSDATPSSLDSEEHPLNHKHVRGSYTAAYAQMRADASFAAELALAQKMNDERLLPEIPKVRGYLDLVHQRAPASALKRATSQRGTHTTWRTTLAPAAYSYLSALLQGHVLPQLERLESLSLQPRRDAAAAMTTLHSGVNTTASSSGNAEATAALQRLWDVAEQLREMIEACRSAHREEVGEVPASVRSAVAEAQHRLHPPAPVPTTPRRQTLVQRQESLIQTQEQTRRGVHTATARGGRASPARRGQSPARSVVSAATASVHSARTSAVVHPALSQSQTARRAASPVAGPRPVVQGSATRGMTPERHYTNSSTGGNEQSTAAALAFNSSVKRAASPYARADAAAARGRAAGLSDAAATAATAAGMTEGAAANGNTSNSGAVGAGGALSPRTHTTRYAPLPAFAAQKVHKAQALVGTSSRVWRSDDDGGDDMRETYYSLDNDPTKMHLTREERVTALLREAIEPSNVRGIAYRRDLFLQRYGDDDGSKRFALWLHAQSPEWNTHFHASLTRRNLTMSELFRRK